MARQRYLMGDRITEADWRLFTTLLRFDPVYHGHFKCNLRRLVDYPNLWAYMRELYQWPGVAETVDFAHIKYGYWFLADRHHVVARGPESIWPCAWPRAAAGRGVMRARRARPRVEELPFGECRRLAVPTAARVDEVPHLRSEMRSADRPRRSGTPA